MQIVLTERCISKVIMRINGGLLVEINFIELVNECKVGNFEKYHSIKNYALKQLSRCRFVIDDGKCLVKALYEEEICQVVFTNELSVYEFAQYIKSVSNEPSPQFMYDQIRTFNCTLIELLEEYKRKHYISGSELMNEIWYKIYNPLPHSCEYRKVFDATWIDYEKQLWNGDIIFDEGIGGLWAMPAEMMLECFNEECVEHYGNRVFVVKPVDDCFYINDGKEIIGERFKVIESLSLEEITDMGKLIKYLVEHEIENGKKLVFAKEIEKCDIRNERDSYQADVRKLQDVNIWLQKRNKKMLVLGIVIGILISFIIYVTNCKI